MDSSTLLFITVVGQDILDIVNPVLDEMTVNPVNPVNAGMLGNFKIFKYAITTSPETAIVFRRELMERLLKHSDILPMFEGGDWMKIYIFKRSAFKTRRIIEDL